MLVCVPPLSLYNTLWWIDSVTCPCGVLFCCLVVLLVVFWWWWF